MTKVTPSNCKETICHWNAIPPAEHAQECIGCEGNKDSNWKPVIEGAPPLDGELLSGETPE